MSPEQRAVNLERANAVRSARAAKRFQLKTGQIGFLDACRDPSMWGMTLQGVLEVSFAHCDTAARHRVGRSTATAIRFCRRYGLPPSYRIEQLKMPTLLRIEHLLETETEYAYGRRQRRQRAA